MTQQFYYNMGISKFFKFKGKYITWKPVLYLYAVSFDRIHFCTVKPEMVGI